MKTRPKPGDEVIWKGYRCYVRWVDGNIAYLVEVEQPNSSSRSDERMAYISELELA